MTLADLANAGSALTFEGKTYTLRKPTLIEQGMFQRWLEQRAHDAVERSTASEEQKDRRHARIDRDAAVGEYEWDGPAAMEALWKPAGLVKILSIVCRDQGVTDELAEKIVQDQVKRVAAAILSRANVDPFAMAPVLAALGLPIDFSQPGPSGPSSNNSATLHSDAPPTSIASSTCATSNSSSSTPSSAAPMG